MLSQPKQKSKIICTIGPASSADDILQKMVAHGMDIARLNFSHGDFDSHSKIIKKIKHITQVTGKRIAFMADLPGPKIRIGQLEQEPIQLIKKQIFTLTTEDIIGDNTIASVNFKTLPTVVKTGDELFLNDGIIGLVVEQTAATRITCRVTSSGELRSRKGVNLPGINLGINAFTERDKQCLAFALKQGVHVFSQSFVSNKDDVIALQKSANELGYNPFIIAKIERADALNHIDDILKVADGIMIARGDLGVEIPLSKMASIQKMLIKKGNDMAKPVITATQMLESMIQSRRPTRAEATDVANAILDGTDAIMLSAESAIGKYPVESVAMLNDIALETESLCTPSIYRMEDGDKSMRSVISRNVYQMAEQLNANAIVTPTRTGLSARKIARFRSKHWVTAFTSEPLTAEALMFSYGVNPILIDTEYDDWTPFVKQWLRKQGTTSGIAVLTQGPSPEHPDANHRLDIINLSKH